MRRRACFSPITSTVVIETDTGELFRTPYALRAQITMKTRVTLYASSRCSTVGARDFYKKFPRSGTVRKDLLAAAATRARIFHALLPDTGDNFRDAKPKGFSQFRYVLPHGSLWASTPLNHLRQRNPEPLR